MRCTSRRALYGLQIQAHVGEREFPQKLAQHSKLPPQDRTSSAGTVRLRISAIFMAHRKRIIEMIEGAASRQHEVPCLPAIDLAVAAEKARFVVPDRFVETVVPLRRLRIRVLEISEFHARQQLP